MIPAVYASSLTDDMILCHDGSTSCQGHNIMSWILADMPGDRAHSTQIAQRTRATYYVQVEPKSPVLSD